MFCFAFTMRMDKGQKAQLGFQGMELFFYLLCEWEARPVLDGGKAVNHLWASSWQNGSGSLIHLIRVRDREDLLVSDSESECVRRQLLVETFIIPQPGTVGSQAHFPEFPDKPVSPLTYQGWRYYSKQFSFSWWSSVFDKKLWKDNSGPGWCLASQAGCDTSMSIYHIGVEKNERFCS